VKLFGIDQFNCLTDENYSLLGNFYERQMLYVELKLWKCRNDTGINDRPLGTICKDRNAIDAYFRDQTFSFAFVNSMFASDSYDKPIQYFIDDQVFLELDPSLSKKANFFV
jgi:hypothetical protein